jgi:mRNA guanylyltransferase
MPDDPTFRRFHRDTLVDGELVLDDVGGHVPLLRYLIFDCLMLDGRNEMSRTLDKRLAVWSPILSWMRNFYPSFGS